MLQAAPLDRQLLYETAFVSGLRRNELAQLTPAHVNLENEALRLDPNWTKNRKPGLQPVPRSLLERHKQRVLLLHSLRRQLSLLDLRVLRHEKHLPTLLGLCVTKLDCVFRL